MTSNSRINDMKLSALAQFAIFFLLILVFLSGCSTEAQRHYELGKWYYEKGLINEAILEFKAATQKDPDFYQAHQSLAIAYAKKAGTTTLSKKPKYPLIYIHRMKPTILSRSSDISKFSNRLTSQP